MITQYSKPIDSPYIPKPWDVIMSYSDKRQSRIASNQALKEQYGREAEAQREKLEMYNMQQNQQAQEEALTNYEEGNLLLSNIKAYGGDKKKLNRIRGEYVSRINDIVGKYSDNPFKLRAYTRAIKNSIKQDVLGGNLANIQDRYERAQRLDQIADQFRMQGKYDDDYYVVQKQDLFHPVGATPDLQGEALQYAKSIPSDSPFINSVEDLTRVIYQNMSNQFQDDIAVRKRAGRSDADIQKMYLGIANSAALSQWENIKAAKRGGKSGSSSSGSSAGFMTNLISLPAVEDPGYKSRGNVAVRKPQYNALPANEIDDHTKYVRANANSLTFIDAATLKPHNGTDIVDEVKDDKEKITVSGILAPGSINLSRIANNDNFVSPYVVSVGSKTYYVERPLNQQATGWGRDVNTISDAMYHPDGYEFVTSFGHPVKARFGIDQSGKPIYALDTEHGTVSGVSPDDVYKKYGSVYSRK